MSGVKGAAVFLAQHRMIQRRGGGLNEHAVEIHPVVVRGFIPGKADLDPMAAMQVQMPQSDIGFLLAGLEHG